jgi:asparagine synthase (glutamine-hydrolysing)
MCGIAGIFEPQPSAGSAAALERMLGAMIPRGPDDEGREEFAVAGGGWMLGARRLAVLDLGPAGHQPMRDPQTGNWLVYNGEIYNFRALRRELEPRGCAFRSQCDTEVLLLALREWGAAALPRLEGMFAFAAWDQSRQELLLARDPHGIKPLYYAEEGGRFVFASELRALLASGLVARALDVTGLDSLLRFGAVQEPATMVRGVRLVPAGHTLRWTAAGARLQRYSSLMSARPGRNGSSPRMEKAIPELREALASAVRTQMVSDVPVGVFLSGGLDSATVAALAGSPQKPVRTFTVTFAEKRYSEGEQARLAAEHLGCRHHEILLSQGDLLASLPRALAAMDQPTVDGINTWFVSRATREAGVTVALSGLGGDELFAGYRNFRLAPRIEQADRLLPQWSKRLAAAALSALPGERTGKVSAWLGGSGGFAHPAQFIRTVFAPMQVARLLRPEWLGRIDFEMFRAEMDTLAAQLAGQDPLNRVTCMELALYMRNTLLRDTDCMSMAHSLEVRVPLLDHRLTALLLRIPGAWKLNGRQSKPLLVAALAQPLPAAIRERPKRGFELPWSHWLRGELRAEIDATLAAPGPVLGEYLDWGAVRKVWREFAAGRAHWSRPWLFYALRKWTERHLET